MLISIAGSQGAGKSTVIAALEKQYKTVTRKTSRSILSDWGLSLDQINADPKLTVDFQREIIKRKYQDESSTIVSANRTPVITERTFTDLFVYALMSVGRFNDFSAFLDEYYKSCKEYNETYDIVFYIKAGHFSIESDGVRSANTHYSNAVDLVMLDYTKRMVDTDRLIVIDTPVLSERLDIIVATIKDFS